MTYEYEVQFGRMEPDGLGSEKLVYHRDKSGITDIPHAAVAFTGAQPGRWRVRAKNSRGTSAWTEWWGFEFDR